MTENLATLIKKRGSIRRIGVIGMGYVGIPTALFADVPHFEHVYGFQRDSPSSGYKIAMLNRGESPLKGEEPGLEELLKKVVGAGKFSCTADFAKIAECDAVTLAIQTPFLDKKDLLPDFSPLIEGRATPCARGRSSSSSRRSPPARPPGWPARSWRASPGSSPGKILSSRTPPNG